MGNRPRVITSILAQAIILMLLTAKNERMKEPAIFQNYVIDTLINLTL